MTLHQALVQVKLDGLIERSWKKADKDRVKFKQIMVEDGLEEGFLFEVGDVVVQNDKPIIDWLYYY